MQVELQLVGASNRWRLSTQRIRIGRDPGCEVSLPADQYPMVSREHAILNLEGGRLHVSDCGSTNGTLVNGTRTAQAMLVNLDRIRLGKDGPELEVHLVDDRPAAGAATRISEGLGATEVLPGASVASTPTRIANPGQTSTPTVIQNSPATAGAKETRISQPAGKETRVSPQPEVPKSPGPATSTDLRSALSREEEEMIEQKLNSVRNLVYVLLAMVAVLLGVIFYQSQQIEKNRTELNEMRRQAQDAVSQFQPTLDARLNALDGKLKEFDARLATVDAKMREAQDQFLNRLNDSLPKMLDKYIDRKVKQLGQSLPTGQQ